MTRPARPGAPSALRLRRFIELWGTQPRTEPALGPRGSGAPNAHLLEFHSRCSLPQVCNGFCFFPRISELLRPSDFIADSSMSFLGFAVLGPLAQFRGFILFETLSSVGLPGTKLCTFFLFNSGNSFFPPPLCFLKACVCGICPALVKHYEL